MITGASSGIGRALALRVGRAGARTVLIARRAETLEEVRGEIEAEGGKAFVAAADLSDQADTERVAAEILAEHGVVDILVNNAGHSIRRSVRKSGDRFHDYERTMRLNYFGALKLTLAFIPGMRAQKRGHVLNVSTMGMQWATPGFSAYTASKAALDGFSRSLAPEVISDNVHVTTVYMPLVRTPMIEPTREYDNAPAIAPEQAAAMITRAMIDRPRYARTTTGAVVETLYGVAPKTVDRAVGNAARALKRRRARREDSSDRTSRDTPENGATRDVQ